MHAWLSWLGGRWIIASGFVQQLRRRWLPSCAGNQLRLAADALERRGHAWLARHSSVQLAAAALLYSGVPSSLWLPGCCHAGTGRTKKAGAGGKYTWGSVSRLLAVDQSHFTHVWMLVCMPAQGSGGNYAWAS